MERQGSEHCIRRLLDLSFLAFLIISVLPAFFRTFKSCFSESSLMLDPS